MSKYDFEDKRFLVTGGSGFLGTPLIEKLISRKAKVNVLSRNHGKLMELQQKFPTIETISGDVSDRFAVKHAISNVDGVFHLAASKHVTLAEKQVRECVLSNTIGSLTLLEESLNRNLEFVLGISTDKASQVSGVYGASKFLMERLFQQFEQLNPNCDYRIVRYGNVLYSTGSVLCKWKNLLSEGKGIMATDLTATRFFWTVDQAIQLIFDCLENAIDASPYVPEMKAMSIGDVLEAMIQKYAPKNGQLPEVKIIGLQPGENLHEKILENGKYSNEVERYTVEEIIELV